MKKIINSPYSRLFLAGLALTILCAWFSMGAFFLDEHYQVFEFCSYKMGNASPNSYNLPWEFYDKIRASLLPGIAYVFAKILNGVGLYNPFTLAFLLRLITGLSGWFITCRFCLLLSPKFKAAKGANLLVLMSLFLWFVPFLMVRFTAENISGILLLYGVYSILSIDEKTKSALIRYIIAGLLFGVSFFIRVQMTFAIAGFAAWLIFINKTRLKYILVFVPSMAVAIGINVLIDYWFYGEWTFTPYNYYYKNIIQHVASDFNTSPWWYYFTEFATTAVPPLSWLLLIMFFTGVYKNLKNPFVWIIIPFLLTHCIVGHKEFRFLFPVTFIFLYITALGFDYLLYQPPQPKGKKLPLKGNGIKNFYQKIHKYIYAVSLLICIPLLLARTFAPAQVSMYYNKYLYNNVPAKNTPLFYIPNRNVDMAYSLNTSFYKNPDYKTVLIDSFPQLGDYLRNNNPPSALFFTTLSITTSSPVGENEDINWNGYKIKMVYSFFPSWALNHNIDNWKEQIPIFRIYQFTPVDSSHGFNVNKLLQDSGSFRDLDAINSLLSYAHNSLQNGKLEDAEKVLTIVEEKTRGIAIPHLHNYLGILDYQRDRKSDAEKEFNTEIALNLQKEEAFLNLGVLYFRNKNYDSAVQAMNSVISINPNNVYALNNLGVYLLYSKKDYAQAIAYFGKALDLNLDYEQGYINFIICAQHFNEDKVMLKYQRILLDDRNDPYTWVIVHKGMPVSDIQASGAYISDKVMKEINILP